MRFMILALVVVSLVFQAALVHARTYDVEAVGEYVMGDSDTKLEARRIALEQAKRSAVEQIGTYLESETIVLNDVLTKDEIRIYTAAVLKTTVLSEDLAILENKSTVFRIKIKANVDVGVLDKKIKEIKEDSQRKAQLALLQTENTKLLKELDTLSSQLKTGNGAGTKKLREERENLFAKLDNNENAIQITFEKGTLLSLAMKNEDTLAQEKKDVDDFFQMIADNVKFKLGEPQIKLVGDKAELVVDVSYEIYDIPNIIYILKNKYGADINVRDAHNEANGYYYGSIEFGENIVNLNGLPYRGFGFTGINGEAILNYFTHKHIDLVLQIGTLMNVIEISSFHDYGKNILGVKEWVYQINGNNCAWNSKMPKFFKISNIPKDELNNISSINAKVVISNQQ